MKRYDCYYTNDFNSEYPAHSRAAVDGDWVSFEDAQAEIAKLQQFTQGCVARGGELVGENQKLRDELTAANLERDALRGVIAAELRKRADWLRTQSDKGYYVIPSAKADECIWLAEKIEKGLTP